MDADIAKLLAKNEDEMSDEELEALDRFLAAAQDAVIIVPPEEDAPPILRRRAVDPFVGRLPAFTLQDIPRPLFSA